MLILTCCSIGNRVERTVELMGKITKKALISLLNREIAIGAALAADYTRHHFPI
jgi:hypothetical protein